MVYIHVQHLYTLESGTHTFPTHIPDTHSIPACLVRRYCTVSTLCHTCYFLLGVLTACLFVPPLPYCFQPSLLLLAELVLLFFLLLLEGLFNSSLCIMSIAHLGSLLYFIKCPCKSAADKDKPDNFIAFAKTTDNFLTSSFSVDSLKGD